MSKKPVPKKKQAVSSTRSRSSKYAYEKRQKMENAIALSVCKNCGATHRAHFACGECGYYNGKKVMETEKTSRMVTEIEA